MMSVVLGARKAATMLVLAVSAAFCASHGEAKMISEFDTCGAELQVLGSGGPMHGGGRGSSAYLLWRRGEPALVIDMGGDTPTALARTSVEPGALPLLAISHVHPDHVSGLPDFFWGEMTAGRSRPLAVIGPPSTDKFHDAKALFEKLFSEEGAFPDLAGLTLGAAFPIRFINAPGDGETVYESNGLLIRALRVNHGRAPSLAFRVDTDGKSVVFAGDQTMDEAAFVEFAKGADLMVAHAIANGKIASHPLGKVVAQPASIGAAARDANVKRLVLSHLMGAPPTARDSALWSLAEMENVVAEIGKLFEGEIDVAGDLERYSLNTCR